MSSVTPFRRAIVIVLDGVGIGALPDAPAYGDAGSNTLGNLSDRVPLQIPTLRALGLHAVVEIGEPRPESPRGAFGKMAEASAGKDSVTGHWELMGVVAPRPFPVFPDGFPRELLAAFERRIGRSTLGNVAASGTEIIARLGADHLRTGAPIIYTSQDSVVQIAAHVDVVPLEELYGLCAAAFEHFVEGVGVCRVIARPFVGEPGRFTRTADRRDFAQPPPCPTLLDHLVHAQLPVVAVGKIDDLFAGRGITRAEHARGDAEAMAIVLRELAALPAGLLFANLVDFDTLYGHRNDVAGFAANLERFDRQLAAVLAALRPSDLLVVTADHGNDPTTPGTDHSREYVPVLAVGSRVQPGTDLGVRTTFADLGQSLAELFGVARLAHGQSFLAELTAGEPVR